jgi:DNA invertase Pin-like site-specific DNA recombinase
MTLKKSGTPLSEFKGLKCSFDDSEIQAIREERATGVRLTDIAKKYEISVAAAGAICTGRTYKNAPGPIVAPNEVNGYKRSVNDEQIVQLAARNAAGERISELAKEVAISRSYLSRMIGTYNKAKNNES